MPMTTRCPRCGTAFKVVADQLRVRNGLVRCGVCSNIFDGFAAIVGGQDAAAPPAPQLHRAPIPTPAPAPISTPAPASAPTRVPTSAPTPGPTPTAAPPVLPTAASQAASPDSAQSPPHAAPQPAPYTPWHPAPQEPSPIPPHVAAPAAPQIPSHLAQHDARQSAPYPASQQAWESPVRQEQATPRGYDDPAADVPSAQSLPSPIDTDSLRPRQHVPFTPDPKTRPAPHAPYIPPVHQAQPLPRAPERQGDGPYEVRVSDPPLQAPEPAVLRGRGDNYRGADTPQGRTRNDDGDALADADADADSIADADSNADDDIPDRADEHFFVSEADRQRHEYDRSIERSAAAERRTRFFVDPDARDDDYAVVSIPGEARTRYDDSVDAGMAPPQFMDEGVQRRNALIRRLWACGCLLGLIVLALQWVFVYRTSIVAAVPALRPAFQAACTTLGCEVGYARRIERISILSSSLQPPANASSATAEGAPTRLVLAVTMRNRYDKPQPWPALVLQLTDLSDTVVVRKVLRPQDYLPAGAPAAFAAGGEQVLAVPIQVSGVQVNGYQLDKFFP